MTDTTEPQDFPLLTEPCQQCREKGFVELPHPSGKGVQIESCDKCNGQGSLLTPFGQHVRSVLLQMGFIAH